ncbi:MAG: thioredoxin domain-containing protein [Chitinophagaceae bacterium]
MSLYIPVNRSDQKEGKNDAPVILVEYGDYQCPHCGAAYPIIKKIERHFAGQLEFVFRNFPLAEIHPYAMEAACAAEAAGLQQQFWPMHDLIFENQPMLSPQQLLNFGRVIGIDIQRLMHDMRSAAIIKKVENDFEGGLKSGVNGTPTFFINGKRYNGYADFEPLKKAINLIVDK